MHIKIPSMAFVYENMSDYYVIRMMIMKYGPIILILELMNPIKMVTTTIGKSM
jgi:hypothetical protein